MSSTFNQAQNSPAVKFIAIGAVIIIGLIISISFIRSANNSDNKANESSQNEQIVLPEAKMSGTINEEFNFPVKDEKNVEITKLKYVIETAEVRDETVINGQKATAIKGKTFFILNLKLSNSSNKSIDINTRDYVRLIVDDNEAEPLAPNIYNDPVNVQAISTKTTLLGFTVNDSSHKFKLVIGEINGDKKSIDVNLN